jgi:hypothetical protein
VKHLFSYLEVTGGVLPVGMVCVDLFGLRPYRKGVESFLRQGLSQGRFFLTSVGLIMRHGQERGDLQLNMMSEPQGEVDFLHILKLYLW